MEQKLNNLFSQAVAEIEVIADLPALKDWHDKYISKKSEINQALKGLKDLTPEQRPVIGELSNKIKNELEAKYLDKQGNLQLAAINEQIAKEKIDISLPSSRVNEGSIHPLSIVEVDAVRIFTQMGFSVATGPEIETQFHNFDALNMPDSHPARDMQDSFYIDSEHLLRTHTSPVQIRLMQNMKPPLRYVMPGRVYRHDDVTPRHSPVFHQLEGLWVEEGISFADLKGVLNLFLEKFFGASKTRFRPSFFPFTEPSAEVDIECIICAGKGCRVCSNTGWLEIGGAGMVDPAVFKAVGYDEDMTGFAFGMGLERLAILRYTINDIRIFYKNDIRFLKQFS